MVAQTILQLYNQLLESGSSTEDVVYTQKVYELSVSLFSGRCQASGKNFIAHCVGTASILASLALPMDVVAAGLIHNVYRNGDFADGKRVISPGRQRQIKKVVHPETEWLVHRFHTLEWNERGTIRLLHEDVQTLDARERNLLLLYLADVLEKHLDLGVLYYANSEERRMYVRQNGEYFTGMAMKMGHDQLADELRKAFQATISETLPHELRNANGLRYSFIAVPLSLREQPSLRFRRPVGDTP